jgi:nudix-type nucleoside diphosphatase (YffH/AdpP family)
MIKLNLKERVYNGFLPIVKLVFDQVKFNGESFINVQREVIERDNDVVFLTLFDIHFNKLLLVKQIRSGAIVDNESNPFTIEPIAGMVDLGERPIVAAIREAKEEANIDLNESDLTLLKSCYLSPGISNEYAHFYYAEFDSSVYDTGAFGEESESEDIQTMIVDLNELNQLKEHFSVATLVSDLCVRLHLLA